MRKLLLTSSGLDNEEIQKNFLGLLGGLIKDVKVLLIFGVKNDEEMFYVNESKKELINLGIKEKNIIEANINNQIFFPKEKFQVIYFCGGNTYYLLNRIKKLGFDKLIKNSKKEILYVGVSAGSIIAGGNIEISGWGSEGDENYVGLEDLSGLNFTNVAVFPHYRNELKKEVDEFRDKVNYPVIELYNGEAILIQGSKIKKIGAANGN
jgi:dipeptidase E